MLVFSNSIALGSAGELAHLGTGAFHLSQMLFNPPQDEKIHITREDVHSLYAELHRVLNTLEFEINRLRKELPENPNDLCVMKFTSNKEA